MLPAAYNPIIPQAIPNLAQIPSTVTRLASATGAEVVFKANTFEIFGLEHEVRNAITMIFDLDLVKVYHTSRSYSRRLCV